MKWWRVHNYQLSCGKFFWELVKERENLSLLGTLGRTRPLLELLRLSSPEHRKTWPIDFYKKEWHTLRSNENHEEFLFEIFIWSIERTKENITRPTDQWMPQNKLARVGGWITQKARRSRMKMKNVTNQAEDLNGRPCVWMKLCGSHVERLKDVHREVIKG